MKNLLGFVVCLVCILISSCASDVANRYYIKEHYQAKEPKNVELLWHAPSRSYVVIADFQSRGESPEDMRKKAAEIGADAIIVALLGGNAQLHEWAGAEDQHKSYSRIVATAIKYQSE